jgi:ubiquinone/menaquinone biosynthesis C-methylase UbiE
MNGRTSYAPWMSQSLGYRSAHGRRTLDVGCGQGIDVAWFATYGADATGLDLTPRHCELTRAHIEAMQLSARVVIGDAEAMPFPDGEFDLVTSNGVLHHTPDLPAALREIKRVLRPGGEARIILYNRRSLWFWLTMVLRYGILRGLLFRERDMEGVAAAVGMEGTRIGARPLIRFYTPGGCRRLMRAAGFYDVRTEVRGLKQEKIPVVGRFLRGSILSALDHSLGEYVIVYGHR